MNNEIIIPIIDIEKMQGYEKLAGFKGDNSVSQKKVFLTHHNNLVYPCCHRHGAMLCVAIREDGKVWRCREDGCDNGCFQPANL